MTFPHNTRAGTVRTMAPVPRPPWQRHASLLAGLPQTRDEWLAHVGVELRRAEGRVAVAAEQLRIARPTLSLMLDWINEHDPDAAEKLPRATRAEAATVGNREASVPLDDTARTALAAIVEAHGRAAVAADAGIGTAALRKALDGDPVKPSTATVLLAVVAREAAPKGAKTR